MKIKIFTKTQVDFFTLLLAMPIFLFGLLGLITFQMKINMLDACVNSNIDQTWCIDSANYYIGGVSNSMFGVVVLCVISLIIIRFVMNEKESVRIES